MNKNTFIMMKYHKYILHCTLFFLPLFSLQGKVSVTIDRNGGKACNVGQVRMLPPQVIYQRVSPQATSGSTWSNTRYYAPRITSVRATVSRKKPVRSFRGLNGKTIKGYLVSIHSTNKTAKIKSTEGRTYDIPIHSFCSADISYMKTWWSNKRK